MGLVVKVLRECMREGFKIILNRCVGILVLDVVTQTSVLGALFETRKSVHAEGGGCYVRAKLRLLWL